MNYKDVLKKINFEHKSSIKIDNKNKSYVLIGAIKGRDVLLKIVDKNQKGRVLNLKKEYLLDKFINKHNQDLNNEIIVKATILTVDEIGPFAYSVREYFPGKSLTIFSRKKIFWGYDTIRSGFLHKRLDIIDQITTNLKAFQDITTDLRKLNIDKKVLSKRYKDNLSHYNYKEIEKELGFGLNQQLDYFKRYRKDYFSKESIKACNSDFSPANIIVQKYGKIIFSDFELFCYDNYTLDVSYFWLFLYKYPDWQKSLLKNLIKTENDRKYFRMSVIRILMHSYQWPALSMKVKNHNKFLEINKSHLWAKYLDLAGDSFESLTKTVR